MSFLTNLATQITTWANNKFEPKLPNKTGNAGKVLSTDGAELNWTDGSGSKKLEGGNARSVYLPSNIIDCGGA